jgi:hypothetical protein
MRDPVERVAHRYVMRLASREAFASVGGSSRTASAGMTPETLAAFGEHFLMPTSKVAFAGLVKKMKQILEFFKGAPKLWEQFKSLIGVKSLTDIPSALKKLAAAGKKALEKAVHKLFETWPLKLYTIEKGKIHSFNDLLDKVLSKSPKLKGWLSAGARKIGDFGEMLRQKAPRIVGFAMVAIYIWVWMNVVEFEWDVKGLAEAISGRLDFHSFLGTLPGSFFGALLRPFGFGTFTLLPLTIAARILYLLSQEYISWNGRGFEFQWGRLSKDFDVQPPHG